MTPDSLTLSFSKKGWRSSWQDLGSLALAPDLAIDAEADPQRTCAAPWDAAMSMLERRLAQQQWRATEVQLVIADAFLHYALLPSAKQVYKATEITALARIHLDALFGNDHVTDAIAWSPGLRGSAGVACALPQALLQALQQLCARHRLVLTAIVPHFVNTFNCWHRRLGGNGLLVSIAAQKCLMAVIRNHVWHSIRSVTLVDTRPSTLAQIISRELVLQGVSGQTCIYLDLDTSLDVSDWSHAGGIQILGKAARKSAPIGVSV